MSTWRWFAACAGLALGLAPAATGAEQEPGPPEKVPAWAEPILEPVGRLPASVQDKLKLTDEQKQQLARLEKEFRDKNRDAFDRLYREAAAPPPGPVIGGEAGPFMRMRRRAQQAEHLRREGQKLQHHFEAQVPRILTAEQKKQYAELIETSRPEGRRAAQPLVPAANILRSNLVILAPAVQEKLGLSQKQKDQVDRLRKEFDDKLGEVLTDEQKKQLEDVRQLGLPLIPFPLPGRAAAEKKEAIQRQRINPPGLSDPSRYYTHVVSARGGKTVYVSGQVAFNAHKELVGKGDLPAQAVRAFQNLKTALAAAGAGPRDVVQIHVYIVNYRGQDIGALEQGLNTCFGKWRGFTSTVLGVQALAVNGLLIEVEAVAVVD